MALALVRGMSSNDLKFSALVEEWKVHCRLKISDGWKLCQDQILRDHILPYLANRGVKEITPAHISIVMEQSKLRGHSPNTQKKIYMTMSKIFNDAVHFFEILQRSPVKKHFHRPHIPPMERPSLSPEQSKEFLKEVLKHDLYSSAVYLQLLAGLRVSEVQGLRWTDIDFKTETMTIARCYNKLTTTMQEYTKNKSHFVLPIAPLLLRYLRLKRRDIGFVCASSSGGMMSENGYRTFLGRIAARSGLPIKSSHGLRHSFARMLTELGASDEVLMQALNHKSIISTKSYIHRSDIGLKKFIKKIS